MAGGAPIPIPTADLDEKILSIKDLEKAASKKLAQSLKGNRPLFFVFLALVAVLFISKPPALQR